MNILQLLTNQSAERPSAEAISVLSRRPYSLNYRELILRVCAEAKRLKELGLMPGDRIAILGNLDDRLFVTLLAASSIQAISLPINMESSISKHVIETYGIQHPFKMVCHTKRYKDFLKGLELPNREEIKWVSIDSDNDKSVSNESVFSEWLRNIEEIPESQVFYVNHTSGSTSTPKLVEATHSQLIDNARACVDFFKFDNTSRFLCCFQYHLHEHLIRPLISGTCSVLMPQGSMGQSIIDASESANVTHLLCNPHVALMMYYQSEKKLEKLRETLKVIEVGGGQISAKVALHLEKTTLAKFFCCYGSTETSGEALASSWSDHDFSGRLFLLPGYSSRIVDEMGYDLAAGKAGELIISGPAVAEKYVVPPPGETKLSPNGFQTKDLCEINKDHGILVHGRFDNAVKLFGTRQPIEPIEKAIRTEIGTTVLAVQILDCEPLGFSRMIGLGSSLLVIVELQGQVPLSPKQKRGLVQRAIRKAPLQAFLTTPTAFILANSGEIETADTGKLRRQHARLLFPFLMSEWKSEEIKRLVRVTPSIPQFLRSFSRVFLQFGAIIPIAKIGSTFKRRMVSVFNYLNPRSRSGRWSILSNLVLCASISYFVFLLVLVGLEDRFVFPRGGNGKRFEKEQPEIEHQDVWLSSKDGVQLHAVFCPNHSGDEKNGKRSSLTVLFCHGNKGSVELGFITAANWQRALGCNVFMFDYRGYGQSRGKPTEEGLYLDGEAAYEWLVKERKIPSDQIVIVGRSLGGAVALKVAENFKPRALILESTFTSLPEVAGDKFPFVPTYWLMRNRFPSIERIGRYQGPLIVSHSFRDEVIPFGQGERLFRSGNEPKRFLKLTTQKHIEQPSGDYYESVRQFLAECNDKEKHEKKADKIRPVLFQ